MYKTTQHRNGFVQRIEMQWFFSFARFTVNNGHFSGRYIYVFIIIFYLGLTTSLGLKIYEERFRLCFCDALKINRPMDLSLSSIHMSWSYCVYMEMVCCMFNIVYYGFNSLCKRISRQMTWHKVFKQTFNHNVPDNGRLQFLFCG